MDSLTHIVLGAAIGEVTLGRKIGNKALIYGAFLGTIPDLDVFITPFLNPVSSLFFHRGFSHSLLFILIITPLVGFAFSKIEKKQSIDIKSWIIFSFLPLLSHIVIDCFNTYGTGIFLPFNNVRVAYDSMAIIDFIFILPISAAVIWALFYHKQNKFRRILTWTGLVLSTLYLGFTIMNKINIESTVKEQLAHQNINYSRLLSTPAPLSNFLWVIVAENETGYNIGYYYNFDRKKDIKFRFLPRNSELLGNLIETGEIKDLIRFTKGYYSIEKDSKEDLWLYDLRYSSLDIENDKAYVFSFKIKETPFGVDVSRSHPNRSINVKNITKYFERFF